MPRVTHFEIQASDPQTLITFYQSLFAWKFQQWGKNAYWLIETGSGDRPGINGGLLPRRGSVAVQKMAIPGVGWLAYIKDPDGNILGVTQPDMSAA